MKVNLSLTAKQIIYLDARFDVFVEQSIKGFINLPRRDKALLTICQDVGDKFSKKATTLSRRTDLFNHKKKHSVTLKYHEAHAVNALLLSVKDKETDPYFKSIAELIYIQLDKKL